MSIKRIAKRGFTLVELMIVVAIVGILAALAIYGVRKYINNAKTTEARESVGRIAKDAAAAWSRENMGTAVLAPGGTAGLSNVLCGTSTPVPDTSAEIAGQKYQSAAADWDTGDQTTGWRCLKFSMSDPQYFQYTYTQVTPTTFTATANGDLDGDTQLSTFELAGAAVDGVVNIAPNIREDAADE